MPASSPRTQGGEREEQLGEGDHEQHVAGPLPRAGWHRAVAPGRAAAAARMAALRSGTASAERTRTRRWSEVAAVGEGAAVRRSRRGGPRPARGAAPAPRRRSGRRSLPGHGRHDMGGVVAATGRKVPARLVVRGRDEPAGPRGRARATGPRSAAFVRAHPGARCGGCARRLVGPRPRPTTSPRRPTCGRCRRPARVPGRRVGPHLAARHRPPHLRRPRAPPRRRRAPARSAGVRPRPGRRVAPDPAGRVELRRRSSPRSTRSGGRRSC